MCVTLVLLPRLSKYFCGMEQLWPGMFLINHRTVLENIFVALRSCIVDVPFGCFLIYSDFLTLVLFVVFVFFFKDFRPTEQPHSC